MAHSLKPQTRAEFEVAIICALASEAEAVIGLFDEVWETVPYGQGQFDSNHYRVGRISYHNVVVALLYEMGTAASATSSAQFRSTWPGILLALVVGVCEGVPFLNHGKDEVVLGDVVISTGAVRYQFGRQNEDRAVRKTKKQDNLSRLKPELQSFLKGLRLRDVRKPLEDQTFDYARSLSLSRDYQDFEYPGAENDMLYVPDFRHKHHVIEQCKSKICAECTDKSRPACDDAKTSFCEDIGCNKDPRNLVQRNRLQRSSNGDISLDPVPVRPTIRFGLVGSSDLVMKSAYHRDMYAEEDDVIAFETEGAGVWENLPTIVIKGVCGYADSHGNKNWQKYAAACAAACTKAVLRQWRILDKPINSLSVAEKVNQDFTEGLSSNINALNIIGISKCFS